MSTEALKDFIVKVPILPVFALLAAYQGYGYWSFTSGPESPMAAKQTELQGLQDENARLEKKVKEAEEFYRTLDQKRAEIRGLAVKLDEMKATLTEELDIPSFVKMAVTEAKRVGINVTSIKPTEAKESEFYAEQTFELDFRGVYVQFFVFLERLSNVERIVRVDDFKVRRVGSSTAPYVEIDGTVKIKAYRYLGSKADEVARKGGSDAAAKGGAAPAPAHAPAGGSA